MRIGLGQPYLASTASNGAMPRSDPVLAVVPELLVEPAVRPRASGTRFTELHRLMIVADVVAGAASGGIAGSLAGGSPADAGVLAVSLAVAWPLAALGCGLYAGSDLRSWASGVGEVPKLVFACVVLSWPFFGLAERFGLAHSVRGALVAVLTLAAAASLLRVLARATAHRGRALRQRTLLIGSGPVAHTLAERLSVHGEFGLDAIGYVDDDADESGAFGLPQLGGLGALADLIALLRIDRVIIAFSRATHDELLGCLRVCRDSGVAVDVVPRLYEFLYGARAMSHVGGMPLLSLDLPTLSRLSRACKRALDIIGAALALLAFLPIMAIVAIAIKLDSPGPVLFVQLRAGAGGRFFSLYKFRSMRTDATVLVRDDGAIVKTPDDARITRVGALIRRLSLDEAPQLFNVLRGDMSLVGPRPLVQAEAEALTEAWHIRRSDLRPGLTGLWQVSGRSHLSFQEMLKLDYQYVAGWSLARDLEILLATAIVVVTGRGAC